MLWPILRMPWFSAEGRASKGRHAAPFGSSTRRATADRPCLTNRVQRPLRREPQRWKRIGHRHSLMRGRKLHARGRLGCQHAAPRAPLERRSSAVRAPLMLSPSTADEPDCLRNACRVVGVSFPSEHTREEMPRPHHRAIPFLRSHLGLRSGHRTEHDCLRKGF